MFSDVTVYPEAPGGERQPKWKFPFDFFFKKSWFYNLHSLDVLKGNCGDLLKF